MAALESYLSLSPRAGETVVSTFGFGYDLDSKLLLQLAERLGGMYMFIPDSSFVGTAFVNWIANAMSTMWQLTEMVVEPLEGSSVVEFIGSQGQRPDPASGEVRYGGGPPPQVINIGFSIYGQNRQVSFRVKLAGSAKTSGAPCARVRVRGYPGGGRPPVEMVAEATVCESVCESISQPAYSLASPCPCLYLSLSLSLYLYPFICLSSGSFCLSHAPTKKL